MEPLNVEGLINILGSTVKHDDQNKAITFLTMLLTYTEEDQINLGFLAESSTGKSYIPLELSWYFPSEDVIKLGYASPTAFFYDYGTLMLKEGIPVNFELKPTKDKIKEDLEFEKGEYTKEDLENEYKKQKREWQQLLKGSYYLVDLHQKILIFLDMPHDMLLQRLRSLLSHDDKQIMIKSTDKKERLGLRTKTVVVKGFPTVIFCSAKFSIAEQEKTRLLLLSPEISQEKLRESIALKIEKESDREGFNKRMSQDPERVALKNRVEAIKNAHIKYVLIPEEKRSFIYNQFLEDHKFLAPRHQRDITRLLALIKAHALLNFMFRKREGDAIIVGEEDVQEGFQLYYGIAEANEIGLSPELFNLYVKVKPHIGNEGITRLDFQKIYFNEFHKPLGYDYAGLILKTLTGVGLLYEEQDPNDKRKTRYMSFEGGVKNSLMVEKAVKIEKFLPPSQDSYIFSKENVEKVLNALFEAARVRGSATLEEVTAEAGLPEPFVKAVLEALQREGKAFSPYPGFWKVV